MTASQLNTRHSSLNTRNMKYDPTELKEAVEQGERRLAQRRQNARRQKKRALWSLAGLVALCAMGVGLWWGTRPLPAPAAPSLVVTWPGSKTPQIVASGATVLAREGQPITVSLSAPSVWSVLWGSGAVGNTGETFEWAPQKDGDVLLVHARAKSGGWSKRLPAETLAPELSLRAATAVQAASLNGGTPVGVAVDNRRALAQTKGPVWLLPSVQASAGVAWDERALSALSGAAPAASGTQNGSQKNVPPLWEIVSDFEGNIQKSTPDASPPDGATYVTLRADNLSDTLPRVGAQLVRLAPDASIKWIARLDQNPPQGVFRISFDGKHLRQAWIKPKGATAGTPLTGWENGSWKGIPAPLSPTPAPTFHQ